MLASAGLGDDARLAHAARKQNLADAIVDFVRAGVIEIFALEPDLCAAQLLGPAPRMVDRTGAADEMAQLVGVFFQKAGIRAVFVVSGAQLVQGMHQRFRNEGTAELAEMPFRIGQSIGFQGITLWLCKTIANGSGGGAFAAKGAF